MTVGVMTTVAVESETCEVENLEAPEEPRRSAARAENLAKPEASSILRRWWKFNLVGGIGIAVQIAALFLLKSVLQFNYLVATAIAVEIAVLHNFVWHERFTWVDRVGLNPMADRIGLSQRNSLRRLLRFHLANGLVSILGNLALMKVIVGLAHMNYLAANAVAIALCSLANFIASERWVFEESRIPDCGQEKRIPHEKQTPQSSPPGDAAMPAGGTAS
jgi:putative flippase GtrA